MPTPLEEHYQRFGLKTDASLSEVKNAYRRLAMKYHPDKNPGDPFAAEVFRLLQRSYDVLSATSNDRPTTNSRSSGASGPRANTPPRPGSHLTFTVRGDATMILAVGPSFWVAGGSTIERLTSTSTSTLPLPGTAVDFTVSESTIWAVTENDPALVAINASTSAILHTILLDERPYDVAAVGESVWVSFGTSILAFDPADLNSEPETVFESDWPIETLLPGSPSECFGLDADQEFIVRLGETSVLSEDWIELGERVSDVVWAHNMLWVGCWSNRGIRQIDPSSGITVNEWLDDPPRPAEWLSAEVNEAGVWFVDETGKLRKLDPVAGRLVHKWDLRRRTDFLVARAPNELWGVDEGAGHLFRIDNLLR